MKTYTIANAPMPVTLPLATAFIDKYMPGANPTYVMVYLYGLRLCYSAGADADNKKIAADLDILETDVCKAFKYWESLGIVKDTGNGLEFMDLTIDTPEPKPQKPRYKSSEIARMINENTDVKHLIKHAEDIFGNTLSANETATLLSFYDWLGLPVEVILMLLEHCASLHKTSMRYAEKIAVAWSNDGIDTIEKAKEHLKYFEKREKLSRSFKKLFGIVGRNLSDAEYAHIIQWTENMKMETAVIKAAYEKTVSKVGGISFPYMNGILQSWYNQGITKAADIAKDMPSEKKQILRSGKGSSFTSYEQTGNYDYLDEYERKALERRMG